MLHQVVLELVALAVSAFDRIPRRFLRELSKSIELSSPCQALFIFFAEAVPTHCWRSVPRLRISIGLAGMSPIQKFHAAQNIKERPAHTAPEPTGLTGDKLLGLAMACSL